MRRFFSAESAHGSSTSHGFCNDTIVRVFGSKIARDEYIRSSPNLSCKPIEARAATRYAANLSLTTNRVRRPTPFTQEYWGIVYNHDMHADIPGCLGDLDVCDDYEGYVVGERLYK